MITVLVWLDFGLTHGPLAPAVEESAAADGPEVRAGAWADADCVGGRWRGSSKSAPGAAAGTAADTERGTAFCSVSMWMRRAVLVVQGEESE